MLVVLSTVPLLWRQHVESRKPRRAAERERGQLNELGRGWSKSFKERTGFMVRKATKTAKKFPPTFEDLTFLSKAY